MLKKILVVIIYSFSIIYSGISQSVIGFKQEKDKINVETNSGTLVIKPLSDNAVRINFYKGKEIKFPELIFTSDFPTPEFRVNETSENIEVIQKFLSIEIEKKTGTLSYFDKSGKVFLNEKTGSRKLIPDSVMGEPCFFAELSFESPSDEYIFGLGQFQDGHYNLRGVTRKLTQVNSQISLPFIYSSKGYGLLWHQYGLTDFNPADNFISLEKQNTLTDSSNSAVMVTTSAGSQKVAQDQSLFKGKLIVPKDGKYSIMLDLGDMGNRHYVIIDGNPVIDQSNWWLPPTVSALVKLKAGEHFVQVICKSENNPKISWKLMDEFTTFRSPNAFMLDYVIFCGSADSVISSYRKLSGNAPLLPLWAYGFWQCRERYTSGNQLAETVKEFRKRNFPMDVIVQDWQYWGNNGWGVPKFDTINYSNPAGFIKEIHDLNAHFNISIWSNPDRNSELGKEYSIKNLYIPDSKWLDYFNPSTREAYWNTLNTNLFAYGVDSWWMDATEPENDALKGQKTFIGAGDFYRLTYPLMVCKAVYDGQRKTSSAKRVCILTRSAFLGQQRYGTINWSGDVGGTWDSYRRQVVAGLNYTITGMPYWTTDIGGFFRPFKEQYTDEKYHELLTRWFQWGTFNPIFRVHGFMSETEPWKFGKTVETNIRTMLNLRYRLMPYIYSEAWQVTKGSTMMRPLVMDFNSDTAALNNHSEYMFGKEILVAPVTEPNISEWNVYLPESCKWYNFWTGQMYDGGNVIKTASPVHQIPLFVKAGSIIPMGQPVQSTADKSDTLEIRVYKGTDSKFELYEDEGDNYNYEKGYYTLIQLFWNEKNRTLTIDKCVGNYPGLKKNKIFNIVFVDENNGIGINEKTGKLIHYRGEKIDIINK